MPDPTPDRFDDAADRSIDAGIADETAAYEKAIDADERPDAADEE